MSEYPKELFCPEAGKKGRVKSSQYRQNLRNLHTARNDTLINNYEPHLLLANLGNIDWRPLINLWSILEYLTKYTAKTGKGSKHLGKLFEEVLQKVYDWEEEDGMHDLYRRTIMKFYSQIIGGRDYSLLETIHFGLRLPGVLSSFGPVQSVSISNWNAVKHSKHLKDTGDHQRATYLNKLELFNERQHLKLPQSMSLSHLECISLYCFWRLYDVHSRQLSRRQREK